MLLDVRRHMILLEKDFFYEEEFTTFDEDSDEEANFSNAERREKEDSIEK